MFLPSWTAPAGTKNTSPALSVFGGWPSTRSCSVPSTTKPSSSPGCVCRPACPPGMNSARATTACRPWTVRSWSCRTVRVNPGCCAFNGPIPVPSAAAARAAAIVSFFMLGSSFCWSSKKSGEGKPQCAQLLDRRSQPVACLEPHLLLLGIARDHALGSTGVDDVAGQERHQRRGVTDDRRAVVHHVAGVRGLAHFSVHRSFYLEVVRIGNLVGRNEVGSEQPEAVAGLADHPLAAPRLQVARGEVVADAVAEHVRERLGHDFTARDLQS